MSAPELDHTELAGTDLGRFPGSPAPDPGADEAGDTETSATPTADAGVDADAGDTSAGRDTVEDRDTSGDHETDGEGVAPRRRRRRWVTPTAIGIAALVVAGLAASTLVTLPYYAIAPGSAKPVDTLVRVSDPSKVYPHQGNVLFLTVSLYRARPLDAIHSWIDHDIQLVPEKQILGDVKPGQLDKVNLQEMTDSKDTAVAVALRRLGYKEEGAGTLVTSVGGPKVAAAGHLKAGDVITAINGTPTPLSQDAVAMIRAAKPGATARLVVRGQGSDVDRVETLTLGASPDSPSTAYLGVSLDTKDDRFDIPYNLSIDSGSVGGPSAGLAFTLELIDTLTPGNLTGGKKIAVTGTIEPDGSVGPVGGVVQKTAAAKAAGARYFLVPPDEFADASAHAGPNLKVVQVSSLDQALDTIRSFGGDLSGVPQPVGPATVGK